MAFDPVTAGIDLITSIINKAADKYLPAAMSDKEKESFKLEARKLAMEESKTLTDFVKATEPEAQYTAIWMNNLRASVRPGIAWLSFASYQGMMVYLTYTGKMDIQSFVAQAGALSTMAIGFYFGQRQKEG